MAVQRPERTVYSVSGLNREVGQLLAHGLPGVWVEGEVSNFTAPSSGHWYFTLKDRDAQIRCAMFKGRQNAARLRPANGQQVVLRGRVGLYEPRGDYQLTVEALEPAGEGALRREFDQLRQRLTAEGLFAEALKRPLPVLPRRIAVVTSGTGAALRDILHVLARRYPLARVVLLPIPVQGEAAPAAICAALQQVSVAADCQVVILARGGGSLEDLWAFNNEAVARAIRACALPVVTGIGHETDFTIADFAADLRAPTPSAAAERVSPDQQALRQQLATQHSRLLRALHRQLGLAQQQHRMLAHRLQQAHPGQRLRQQAQRLDDLEQRLRLALHHRLRECRQRCATLAARLQRAHAGVHLQRLVQRHSVLEQRLRAAMARQLIEARQRLALAARALEAVSPLATLTRGYAIATTSSGQAVLDAAQLHVGDALRLRFARGSATARLVSLTPEGGPEPAQTSQGSPS